MYQQRVEVDAAANRLQSLAAERQRATELHSRVGMAMEAVEVRLKVRARSPAIARPLFAAAVALP